LVAEVAGVARVALILAILLLLLQAVEVALEAVEVAWVSFPQISQEQYLLPPGAPVAQLVNPEPVRSITAQPVRVLVAGAVGASFRA
jgi:hypothetical protein